MTNLLDHLGVALLGHIEYGKDKIPPALHRAWDVHQSDKRRAPDLFAHLKLLDFLHNVELRVPDDFLGAATLTALGYIFGHVSLNDEKLVMQSPDQQEQLLCRLRGRIRITIGPRRYEPSPAFPRIPKK